MAGRLRLMHAALDMDIGGLQRLITDMVLAIDRDKFEVEVVCFDRLGSFAERLKREGVVVTLLQKNQERFDAGYPFRLRSFLREKQVDIFHSHTGTFAFAAAAGWLARTAATVYTEHGRFFKDPFVRVAEDFVAGRLIDRVVAVSADLHQYLTEKIHIPKRKTVTIINGIQTKDFSPRPRPANLMREFGIAEDAPVIGTVGRLDDVKDQATLIDAFMLVHEHHPEARLVLVGEGPERAALEAQIKRLALGDAVILTGSRSDIADWLSLFDVFALTSLSEGTSISLLEAMASGVAPVVTKVGGNPTIVNHEENGLLIETGDSAGTAAAFTRLLSDRVLHDRLAAAARKRVLLHYSLAAMLNKYLGIYEELLHRRRNYRDLQLR